MKVAVLFSGGKDSTYALYKAMKKENIVCLISIISENKESYMFHTPNIEITKLQAEAIGLPLLTAKTRGEKEKELADLKNAIKTAKEKYKIAGIVTGALKSRYQKDRIARLCKELKLKCINPLWGHGQLELLKELLQNKFKVIITAISAYPLDEKWLGRELDVKTILELSELSKKYQINPAGEGGEFETAVLDAPFFKKSIEILDYEIKYSQNAGIFIIKKARLAATSKENHSSFQ